MITQISRCSFLRGIGAAATLALWTSSAQGQNQTPTVSPIVIGGKLPYTISLSIYQFGATQLPMLHSFALGVYNGKWVIVAGRTNGLHNPFVNGFQSFPPASQNTLIWVIDPVAKSVLSRSLADPTSGLTATQVDSLSATNTESVQIGDRLYIAGGYVYDSVADNFTTFSTLTALDLPGVIDWVTTGAGSLVSHLRQTSDPVLKVTGGTLHVANGRALLIFGHDYDGPYMPGVNGVYTEQVRAFDIMDNGVTLSIANIVMGATAPEYHRRDLNIVPMLQSDGAGGLDEGFIALSGYFTVNNGAWTVPVEIDASGTLSMADPNNPATFKQGMNNYDSANINLYSESRDETHTVLLGGISFGYYNTATGAIAYDLQQPFINSMSSIVRTSTGDYTQYYLGEYPKIPNPSNGNAPFLFGTNAKFIPAAGIATYDNGMLKLDMLTQPTVIGYVFGGIVAQIPNFGGTGASNLIFQVTYSPAVSPAPAPAPSFRVRGKSVKHTGVASFVVRGSANSSTSYIEWRLVGKKKFRKKAVQIDGTWKIRVSNLQLGKNIVRLRGVSADGQRTKIRAVTILRPGTS